MPGDEHLHGKENDEKDKQPAVVPRHRILASHEAEQCLAHGGVWIRAIPEPIRRVAWHCEGEWIASMRAAEKECHRRFGAWDKHDYKCRITRRQCLYAGKYWDHARQTCTTPNLGCKWDQERGTCIPYHAYPKNMLEH